MTLASPMTEEEFRQHAETYIDMAGLDNAIAALAEVCHLKAEHVRAAWQDEVMARDWVGCANVLMGAEAYPVVRRVSGRSK